MTIDLYSSTGTKSGTITLPESLFAVRINMDLMHQAVMMQQGNRRASIAHAKNRGEVAGSTKKAYDQKHTGRARRGPIRSPLLRGGGKAFGPRSSANFTREMPRAMRHLALASSLTQQAKNGALLGLKDYPATVKTKTFHDLLKKLPVQIGRRLLFVVPEKHDALYMSSRNVPGVKVIRAGYLNPQDVLLSRSIIFVGDAIEKAEAIFAKKADKSGKMEEVAKGAKGEKGVEGKKEVKKKAPKAAKTSTKKKSSSSPSSPSLPS